MIIGIIGVSDGIAYRTLILITDNRHLIGSDWPLNNQ